MFRKIITVAMFGACLNAAASPLMDASPGMTLSRLAEAYPKQLFYRTEGTASFADMEGSSAAYLFLDVGAKDTLVGAAWLSMGPDDNQAKLFSTIKNRYLSRSRKVIHQEDVTTCSAVPGGKAFELSNAIFLLDDGTTLSYGQLPAFSSVSILRGSAAQNRLEIPDWSAKADELEKNQDKFNSYQKAWAAALQNQLRMSLNALPDLKSCTVSDKEPVLQQPIALGKAYSASTESGRKEGIFDTATSFSLGDIKFQSAQVAVEDSKAVAVQYAQDEVDADTFNAAAEKLTASLGAPTIKAAGKEGDNRTVKMAWKSKADKKMKVSLQYASKIDADKGRVQLTIEN